MYTFFFSFLKIQLVGWKPQLTNYVAFVGHFKSWTKGEGLDFLGCVNVKSGHFRMWGTFTGSKGRGGKGQRRILDLGRCSEDDRWQSGSLPLLRSERSSKYRHAFRTHLCKFLSKLSFLLQRLTCMYLQSTYIYLFALTDNFSVDPHQHWMPTS